MDTAFELAEAFLNAYDSNDNELENALRIRLGITDTCTLAGLLKYFAQHSTL